MVSSTRWHHFPDAAAVAGETVKRVLVAAQRAIAARGEFRVVLAGGGTPGQAYRQLAGRDSDWSHWHIYLGDERCLAPDDAGRNSLMIERAWLDHSPVPAGHIHWIAAERGAEQGADDYQAQIEPVLPFDLVLLGMGEDGHTASLFPGHRHDPARLVVPVHNAPKPPPDRISLNIPALAQTREMLLLITGAGKSSAVHRWRNGEPLPVATLACDAGIDVLIDQSATGITPADQVVGP
jgi:6-phosphogluconolactonase